MDNRHSRASSCSIPFGKTVKPEWLPVVKWTQIQFKVDIVLPLLARPQIKHAHVPAGEYEHECLLSGWQAAIWALGTASCSLLYQALCYCHSGVPKLAHCSHHLLPYTGTRCFAELQVTASARCPCCCPCSKENSAPGCVSIVQDMKQEFVLPLCHCPCPINSIVSRTWGRALLGGSSWSPAILAGIQNRLYGNGSHGLLLLFLLITKHLPSWSLSK